MLDLLSLFINWLHRCIRSFAESKKFQNTRQGQKESSAVGYGGKREVKGWACALV